MKLCLIMFGMLYAYITWININKFNYSRQITNGPLSYSNQYIKITYCHTKQIKIQIQMNRKSVQSKINPLIMQTVTHSSHWWPRVILLHPRGLIDTNHSTHTFITNHSWIMGWMEGVGGNRKVIQYVRVYYGTNAL